MIYLDARLYIAGCVALWVFQLAHAYGAARSLSPDARVPTGWGLLGRPLSLASPYYAFMRGAVWSVFGYAAFTLPLYFFWDMPDVSPAYMAMTGLFAICVNVLQWVYVFFAVRHVRREEEESVFMKAAQKALADRTGQ